MSAKRKSSEARRKFASTGATRTMSDETRPHRSALTSAAIDFAERIGLNCTILTCLLLGLLTTAVYAQVWRFDFITVDDPNYVSTNPHVQFGLSLTGIKWAFTKFYFSNWTPLTWLSYMLDASLYQNWAGGYHITNVIVHVANVLLLFHLLKKTTGGEFTSAFAAALFAVHPIHAESVAWISERKDVLSIFFGLLSLSAYVSYARQPRVVSYVLSLVLFVASLMSKPTLVTMPCVMLLLDYWPLARLSVRGLVEKIPFFALAALLSAVTYLAQANGQTVQTLDSIPIAVRLATVAIAYASYLQKALVPWNLGVFYPYSPEISLVQVAVSIVVVVLLTAAAVLYRRRAPFFTVGWFWFLGTLVPMIGLVQVGSQQMADRYAYFSFIGLYLAIAGFVTSRRLAIAIIGVTAVLGFLQVGYWTDTLTLADHTLRVTHDNAFLHYTKGDALVAEGRVDDAMEEFRKPVLLEPWDASWHCKWAETLLRFNRVDEARSAYLIALALNEKIAAIHAGLGTIDMQRNQIPAARREFQRALEIDPGDQTNYFNLALLCRMQKDYEGSIGYCRGALKVNDNMVAAHLLIAENLRQLGRPEEANAQLREVLAIAPYDDRARELLDK